MKKVLGYNHYKATIDLNWLCQSEPSQPDHSELEVVTETVPIDPMTCTTHSLTWLIIFLTFDWDVT